jgi:hypothetical protein
MNALRAGMMTRRAPPRRLPLPAPRRGSGTAATQILAPAARGSGRRRWRRPSSRAPPGGSWKPSRASLLSQLLFSAHFAHRPHDRPRRPPLPALMPLERCRRVRNAQFSGCTHPCVHQQATGVRDSLGHIRKCMFWFGRHSPVLGVTAPWTSTAFPSIPTRVLTNEDRNHLYTCGHASLMAFSAISLCC